MGVTVEFDPSEITFADLQEAFQNAAQAFQAADTELISNGEIVQNNNIEPLRVRRFNEHMYVVSGYRLPDPSQSPVTTRLQSYQQNPLVEAHQPGTYNVLVFQHGDRDVVGNTGVTIESLLSVCMDRLQQFQLGDLRCPENYTAIKGIFVAINALNRRALRVQGEQLLESIEGESDETPQTAG